MFRYNFNALRARMALDRLQKTRRASLEGRTAQLADTGQSAALSAAVRIAAMLLR